MHWKERIKGFAKPTTGQVEAIRGIEGWRIDQNQNFMGLGGESFDGMWGLVESGSQRMWGSSDWWENKQKGLGSQVFYKPHLLPRHNVTEGTSKVQISNDKPLVYFLFLFFLGGAHLACLDNEIEVWNCCYLQCCLHSLCFKLMGFVVAVGSCVGGLFL